MTHKTVKDVKIACANFLLDLIGTSNLELKEGDDDWEVDWRALEAIRGHDLESHASLLTQGLTPQHHAARVGAYGRCVSNNARLNARELVRHDMVWTVRRFAVDEDSGVEETDLISSSSIFGRQGEKLYLHAVLNHQSRGMLLLPLQLRNGNGVSRLPRDVRVNYVRVLPVERKYKNFDGTLAPLFMRGRDVPDGLTLFLLPISVSYGDYMCLAAGSWCPPSKALLTRYVEASTRHEIRTYTETSGITKDDFMAADCIIDNEIGNLSALYESNG